MKEGKTRSVVTLTLKMIVLTAVIIGVVTSSMASAEVFMSGRTVFMYFTIQSNILIGLISLAGAIFLIKGYQPGVVLQHIFFVGTVAITLTGVVFSFILAPTLGDKAWTLQNILTHVVVPLGAIIDFFIMGVDIKIPKRSVLYVVIPPIAYAVYAVIGFIKGWEFSPGKNYPYFFLNWASQAGAFGFCDELPFMGCAWWILTILIILIAIGYLYLRIVDIIKKRQQK
ncbi:MAG: Pr6Pr family membrane protein [Lachnospiraceae bacterium]|nr:Pr6Pr family membrane protein [Lachnospiraceae bacterium]